MFRDKEEELKRLENELLQEDKTAATPQIQWSKGEEVPVWEREDWDPTVTQIVDVRKVQAYNADQTEEDLEQYSQEVYAPEQDDRKTILKLSLTATGLLLCILALLIFWIIRFL